MNLTTSEYKDKSKAMEQYTTELTVAFISGEVTTNPAPRGAELIQAHGLLDLTAQFLTRLAQERQEADPQLKFFYAPLDAV
jgi:hypothetical protein